MHVLPMSYRCFRNVTGYKPFQTPFYDAVTVHLSRHIAVYNNHETHGTSQTRIFCDK